MAKGAETRERIIARAAPLFNQRGFAGAAMSDIMAATGLEKGGIYRHFGSKEALAVETFDYATRLLTERFERALAGKTHAIDRMRAIFALWRKIPSDPPVPGGCYVMNTAIESDDTNPVLRDRARRVLRAFERRVFRILEEGIARHELERSLDAERFASVVVATLEGALMLSRLHDDDIHLHRATEQLEAWLASHRRRARRST